MRPTGAALGADIEGVDLAQPLSSATVAAIKQAWSDHLVLRFRGQQLDDDRLMRFSALFGELDLAPVIAAARVKVPGEDRYVDSAEEGQRYVSVISNIIENGVAIGALGAYEAIWHTDMSYNPEPPIGSALYSLEVPPSGGDTGFANMYLAYDTLPDGAAAAGRGPPVPARFEPQQRRRIAPRLIRGHRSARRTRRRPPDHPHPSGHRAARRCFSAGAATPTSRASISPTARPCSTRCGSMRRGPKLTWYQQWRVGDLILWDNRCVMHRRDEFDPQTRRLMHRTQIKGDRPF